jgi:polar amino acid transport system substrate-binding protein
MHMSRSIIVSFILFMIPVALPAQEPLIISLDESNPPFMYANESSEAAGLYPLIINEVFGRMGVLVELQAVPWRRAILLSERGETGIGGLYFNTPRSLIYDYSDALYSETISVYIRKEDEERFRRLEDLRGMTIGTIFGWSYGDDFDGAVADGTYLAESAASDEANFGKLVSGRIDSMLALAQSGDFMIRRLGIEDQVIRLEVPIAVNETYIAFAKSAALTDLIRRFNLELAALRASGEFEELIERFFQGL